MYATGPSVTCILTISSNELNHFVYSLTDNNVTPDWFANFSSSPGAQVATLIPHLSIKFSSSVTLAGNSPTS